MRVAHPQLQRPSAGLGEEIGVVLVLRPKKADVVSFLSPISSISPTTAMTATIPTAIQMFVR
jgi:hypothetical protein